MKSWYPNIISLFSGEGVASGRGAGAGVHQCVSTLISNQVCLCIDVCAIRKSLFSNVSFVAPINFKTVVVKKPGLYSALVQNAVHAL